MWRSYLQRFVLLVRGQIVIFPYSRTAYTVVPGRHPTEHRLTLSYTHQAASFVRLEILTLSSHGG